MISNNLVPIGSHCWALAEDYDGKKLILIVLKTSINGYQVCGPWECGMNADDLEIIKIIPRPAKYLLTPLYYGNEE